MLLLETMATVPAMGLFSLAWLLIVIPLTGATLLLVLGRFSDSWGHWLTTACCLASFAIGVLLFNSVLGASEGQQAVTVHLYDWISIGFWSLGFGMLTDQLSILLVLLTVGVGSLVHIYLIGYMAHDERRRESFAYSNLSIAAVPTLALIDSYLVPFLGWEDVDLASHLPISFWQHKPFVATAGRKVFTINHVGDLGVSTTVFTMLSLFGSTTFSEVNAGMPQADVATAMLLGLLLLFTAYSKSAQVPLQSRLLDVMEGPTPVSILIYVAAMVAAGIHSAVRNRVIYEISEAAALAVAIMGVVTLLVDVRIDTAKGNIRKVLAGSTMSQIGYMMSAAGLGPMGVVSAIPHLIAHGFLKANMLLDAGSMMRGIDDDVNMHDFGILVRTMRWVSLTFATGYLAIISFPFVAGYYSKDHIIETVLERNVTLGVLVLTGAGITACYMTYLMMMTPLGCSRWEEDIHSHESLAMMTVLLMILATASLGAGFSVNNQVQSWLVPATGSCPHETGLLTFSWIGAVTLVAAALGVALGWWLHSGPVPERAPWTRNPLVLIGRNDLYGDAVNIYVVVRPVSGVATALSLVDQGMVDGLVRGSGYGVRGLAGLLREVQNGCFRTYGPTLVVGVVVLGAIVAFGQLT